MQVFLLQQVSKLGHAGDLVTAKAGYIRNFLIPRKLAIPVTRGTQKQIEEQKKHLALALARQEKRALELKDKIEQLQLAVAVQAEKEDKIFGAVTNQTLQKQLKQHGISLDRKKIQLEEPIHRLGEYTIPVKLSSQVEAVIKLKVVKA